MIDDILDVTIQRLSGKVALENGILPVSYHQPLEERHEGLPEWWGAKGNVMLCPPGATLPNVSVDPYADAPSNARVVLGCATMPDELLLWGDGAILLMGEGTRFPSGRLCCGGQSTIVIGDKTSTTWSARVDCRNGGIVIVGQQGLWATDVQINSDDMHAIRDLEGKRLNAFGGVVSIGRSVWLAYQALVLNGANIGSETVVGARGLVTGLLPANSVCVGVPARPVKTATRWAFEDLP